VPWRTNPRRPRFTTRSTGPCAGIARFPRRAHESRPSAATSSPGRLALAGRCWRRDFEDTAQLALVELDEAAVLEISGKVTILSLADGKVRFETTAERETQVRQIHMIRSRDHYVLIANQSTGGGPGWQQVTPQVIPVHGRVYGYDRQNGKRLWTTQIDRHGIDLHQPGNLPVLTFVSHYALAKKAVPGLDSHFALTCLDKRNGRLAFDNRDFDEQILYVEYGADVEQKQLDLRLFRSVLRLTFTDKAFPDE
jgi:hypothetical protein